MGAAFGCFVAHEGDAAEMKMRWRPRSKSSGSLLGKLQRSLSSSTWLPLADDSELSHGTTGSRSHEAEDWRSWDAFLTTNSSATVSSGCRMLSEVYSQALELGGNAFFLGERGERICGAYLGQIEVLDEYFGVDAAKRERRRLALGRGSITSAELDETYLDADDWCASTMDLDTDLDMERFLTQSLPVSALPACGDTWPQASNALMSYALGGETSGPASEPLHRGARALSVSSMAVAEPPRSWACPTDTNAWQPTKQRELASYCVSRLPRGAIGGLALGAIAPSVAS